MHRSSSSAQAFRSLMSLTAVLSLTPLIPAHKAHAADDTANAPQVTLGNDGNSKSMFRTLFDGQRAIGTGGMTSLEGSSGGGLASWATISGYGSDKSAGMAFHYSYVNLTNYWDQNVGASIGLFDRVELSYTHNFFQTRATGAKLGIGNGYQFDLDVAGAKVRLFGHVADNTLIPQVAVGAMYKHDSDGRIIHMVGSKHTDGADAYLAVTKLFPKVGILIDTTVRFTKGNQWGIIGFGGDLDNSYHPQFEGSLGYLPPFLPGLIVGVEYRTKPRNQRFTDESNWFDVYTSYFINKHLNITLAYVSLGTIATFKNQTGFYFSAQTGF
ncbi:DUF3034 family protein [Gluconobacter albidus]|uniref:DUF3034 family protein n=1 Tax=Gluconobacter albidus TaxID=318683 RepID=UPI0020A0F216|nr:DUF3034 family protein [Gluconobacter albidus]MCP1272946.1 DUF3034 family protein [Gluconobacter albidus]